MKKVSHQTSRKKSSALIVKDISEIQRKVDKILSENKYKLFNKDEYKLDVNRFSLKNKKGESVFFLREKTKKKPYEEIDRLNRKILQTAREKLGKEPINNFDDIELNDIKTNRIKVKKQLKFGKSKQKLKELDAQENKEILKQKDIKPKNKEHIYYDLILTEKKKDNQKDKIKLIPEEDFKKKYEKHVIFSDMTSIQSDEIDSDGGGEPDEKIIQKQTASAIKENKDAGELKANEYAKKHHLFEKKNKDKNEINVGLDASQDLVDKIEKKHEKYLKFSEMTSIENEEIDSDEARFINEKISKDSIKKNIEAGKIETKKKSFFKRKKSSKDEDLKKTKYIQKSRPVEHKQRLRVENLPPSGDLKEKDFTEELNDYDVELKSIELEEKHIEDGIVPTVEKAESKLDKPQIQLKAELLQEQLLKEQPEIIPRELKNDKNLEHIFFDEGDAPSGSWTPQISKIDKKNKTAPISAEFENIEVKSEIELSKDALQLKSLKLSDLGFSEGEWEEIEFYPLTDPFAYAEILLEKESLEKHYFLVEVDLTEEEQKILDFIKESLNKININTFELEDKGKDKYLLGCVEQILEDYDIRLDEDSKRRILYFLEKTSLGLGKIDPLMNDPNIEDISCDGEKVSLFLYHRQYGSLKSNVEFKTEEELSSFIHKLAQKCGKHISIAEPMLDATMPDGSRIQMTLSDEITAKGSTFTIRKFRADPFSPPDLVEFNTMSAEMIAYMWIAVENGVNTLIAGGTAAGKTTVLNALSLFIPREAKIVSIEETREINLPHSNWIPGIARSGFGEVVADKMVGEIDLYDLMKAALRQRPEYILVGEIRGREAYVLFQAMATGHATYSTVHADSAQSLIHRLEGKPINIPRVMLQSLDIISIHVITRVKNKRARRCRQIIEIIDIDPTTKEILTNEVFRWDPVEDAFIFSGKSFILERIRVEKDKSREQMTNEIKNRSKIISWMNSNDVRAFKEVSKIVSQYFENPDEVLKKINGDET